MKKVTVLMIILVVLLGVLLSSACGVLATQSREALAVGDVGAQVNTSMRAATVTPTHTPVPASATPSRMELPVRNATLEIQIMGIERPSQVYFSDNLILTPGEGNLFLGLGIRVTNTKDSDILLKWSDIHLINKYQHKWYPLWGAYKKTNAIIDPLGIELRQFKVDPKNQPDAHLYLGENGYLRAIFRLPRDNYYYYLSFADLPIIEINYADY